MSKTDWIWLQEALGYCTNTVNRIVEKSIPPGEIREASKQALAEMEIFTDREIQSIKGTTTDSAKRVEERCLKLGYGIVTPDDEAYSKRLGNIYAMPAVLYTQGTLIPTDNLPVLAMVGTRDMTEYGSAMAYELSYQLAEIGFVIVSGLAIGIDGQCHKGAIKAGGYTIAVVGAGLESNYPSGNHELREMIVDNGAVVSEYPPEMQPKGHQFPIRNRIISGLSKGVFVVEGSRNSGSLITAGHALSQNREVFALPNRITEVSSRGCFDLIRQGAKPVFSVKDVVEEYADCFEGKTVTDSTHRRYMQDESDSRYVQPKAKRGAAAKDEPAVPKEKSEKHRPKPMPDYLTNEQQMVYSVLKQQALNTEQICNAAGLDITKTLTCLTELEIYGVAKAMPGNMFELC